MENMKSFTSGGEENTKLLFFEHFISPKLQYNIEEIFFSKSILLQQIRILKTDSNPHTKIKSMQSKTQREQIFNFDIFARNLKSNSDKFEYLFESDTVNRENGESDSIFPILSEFVTNHIVIRGKFEKITMCIYGVPFSGAENHQLLEAAKSEVPLDRISKSQTESKEDKLSLTNEDMAMIQTYPIDSLVSSYINCDIFETIIQKAYYINKPNLNMIDKTKSGYIYYENDLIYYSQSLYNFYLNQHKNKKNLTNQILDEQRINSEIEQQEHFQKVFDIIKILITKNIGYLDQDCVFRKENLEIYYKIPDILVSICVMALSGNLFGYTEIKFGLKLLKLICNSAGLVAKFIEEDGMETLYNILFIRERNEKGNGIGGGNTMDYSNILKILVLENMYRLITFKVALERFMQNIDKKKFPQQYFLIKELAKESLGNQSSEMSIINNYELLKSENIMNAPKDEKESRKRKDKTKKEKEKDRNRDKDKDKDKDKDRKSKKKHKTNSKRDKSPSKSKNSRSRSRSRSRSLSLIRSKDKRKNSKESSSSQDSKSKKIKKKYKNIPLKNGYQIILTLVIGKKNNLISNVIKKIINKVSMLLYLQKFGQQVENINNNKISIINVDLVKVSNQLKKIFEYLNKSEVTYKKGYPNDNQCFLNKDYPYTNFWIDYLKTNRKNFKKAELNNIKSTLENEIHSTNKFSEAGIITNEIAVIFEEHTFIHNLIHLLANPQVQCSSQYFDLAITTKNILAYVLLSRGGINFFSKNFEITIQLMALFNSIVDDMAITEDNFFQISLPSSATILTNKSYFEHHKYSKINEVLIKVSDNTQFSDEYIIKLHYLQLKILFCYSFMFLGKTNTLLQAKEENESFIDKSLDILVKISQNISKSNLSRQAFLAFSQNDFFINEILLLLSTYNNNESIEHEAHITLIIQILFFIFAEMSKISDILLLIYGVPCLNILCELKNSLQSSYDMKDLEPINSNFYNIIDGFISFLQSIKKFSESKDMTSIMGRVNDACFSNIQKYNLNDQVNKEEKRKEYFEEYKLNVKNHQNSDVDYLELLESKGTLINDIFASVKIINLSIRINPLLLIDCVSDHIHLTLRYLIVNTVQSIKHYLKPNGKEYELNAQAQNKEVEKYEKLKQYSILLYHTYDILNLLLKNLLSSHVDNYRDTMVIEKTVTLLITLINFLNEVYSGNSSIKENEISITEYIQKLFGCVLETFAQICRFNATIILNFKKVLEKIAEKPSNKPGLIYLLNFMLTVSNNIYTIEIFVDHLTKVQKKPVVDIFNEIESINKINPIKIGHFAEEKTVLSYIIDIGINTNDDWVVHNCSRLILTIYRRYIGKNRLAIYQEITEEILKQINILFNKISKVYFLSLQDKEILSQVPDLESLLRILKFLMPFLKSEFKFLFLFHDVSIIYMNIFSFFKEYIMHNITNDITQAKNELLTSNEQKIKNVIYDIIFLVLEGMLILCDNKRNKDKFNYETDQHYDLAEDIPNKNQLGKVVKELFSFISIFTDQVDIKAVDSQNVFVTKMIIMTNKAIDIFINIASNFYGQNIILYEEFITSNITSLPNNGKPMININSLIKKLALIKDTNLTNDKIYSLIESISMLVIILFYDLNYYENESLHNKRNDDSNMKLLVLTETRLCSLLKLLLPLGEQLSSPIASNLPSLSTLIADLIELFHYYTAENSEMILFELTKLKSLIDSSTQGIDILHLDIKASKPPNTRDINDICEYLYKYSEYYLTQPYGMNFPLQINSKGEYSYQTQQQNPNQNQMFTALEYKQQINEFEKLLNWKKQRIFLSKIDYLNVRNSNIDLDTCLDSHVNQCLINEYDFFQLYKKYYYYNTDQFEQYCNTLFNEELIINSFIQISYSISSTGINKLYLLGCEEEYSRSYQELFFSNLECLKFEIESAKNDKDVNMNLPMNQYMHKIKKKINSKLNQFIYKAKYEKYIMKPPSQIYANKEQNRNSSKVSGRNLSTHVDNVVPGQKVVNLTYGGGNTNTTISQMAGPGHEDQKEGSQGIEDSIINKQSNITSIQDATNKSNMNQEPPKIMTQEQQQPTPAPSHPPQFPNQMMKPGQAFPYQGMPYVHQFVPNQNPNPMMMNQFQGFQPIRLPGPMYQGMPNYPNPAFNQPIMPMNMINPMSNPIQSFQPPILPPNTLMTHDQHNKHITPSQNQNPPSSTSQNPQKNLVDNLGSILKQIKQNMNTSNEGSKDPRIRKKK